MVSRGLEVLLRTVKYVYAVLTRHNPFLSGGWSREYINRVHFPCTIINTYFVPISEMLHFTRAAVCMYLHDTPFSLTLNHLAHFACRRVGVLVALLCRPINNTYCHAYPGERISHYYSGRRARASWSVGKGDSPQNMHLKRGYKPSHGSVCFNKAQIMLSLTVSIWRIWQALIYCKER